MFILKSTHDKIVEEIETKNKSLESENAALRREKENYERLLGLTLQPAAIDEQEDLSENELKLKNLDDLMKLTMNLPAPTMLLRKRKRMQLAALIAERAKIAGSMPAADSPESFDTFSE